MAFKPNKYQQAIYDFISDGEGNAVINAVAGSGKTTTIINALDIISPDKSVLFLAFNKSIVEELKKKIGEKENVDIKTLHSLGAAICYNTFHSTINADKYTKHINQYIKEGKYAPENKLDGEEKNFWKRNIRDLCNLARIELVKTEGDLIKSARKHGFILEDNEIEIAMKVVEWGKMNVAEIDFTDMIYFPNVKKMEIPLYDFVFIDECQDLNAAQRELFLKCVDPDEGRFVGVGDRNQSIYFFSGADAESFDKLVKIPNTRLLPLSVCYRCDKTIVESAKKLVPQIEYREGAEDGVIDKNATIDDVKDGDMVICRTSAPLVKLCMLFLKKGTKAYIKGRDIGTSLIGLIRNTHKDTVKDVIDSLKSDGKKMVKKLCKLYDYSESDAENTSEYQNYIDKVNTIVELGSEIKSSESLIDKISELFSENNGEGICLSTVHKSKGLENERVFILNESAFYPKWAMNNKIQAEQEKNLEYVAITRSKKYLGYISNVEKNEE